MVKVRNTPVVATPVAVAPKKVEKKGGCVANVTAAIKRCFGVKPAVVAPKAVIAKPVVVAPKKVQTKSVLKTALIGAAVLAVVGGGSALAYTKIPAVQSAVDSALAIVGRLFRDDKGTCRPSFNSPNTVDSGLETASKFAAAEMCPLEG